MRLVLKALVFGAFTVFSLLLMLGGEVLTGLFGVLLFGGGGAFYLYSHRAAPPPDSTPAVPEGAVRHGTLPGAERYSAYPHGLVFPGRRRASLLTIAGSAAFIALGAWFLAAALVEEVPLPRAGTEPLPTILALLLGAVALLFFGFFGAAGVRSLLGRGGGIALLPDGVYLRTPAGQGWVRWEDLEGVWSDTPASTGSHIKLLARSAERFTLTGPQRWFQGISRARFDMDVGFPATYLRAPTMVVAAELHRYLSSPEERNKLGDRTAVERVGEPRPPGSSPPVLPPRGLEQVLRHLRGEADRRGADPAARALLLEALTEAGHMQEVEERLRAAEQEGDTDARVGVAFTLREMGRPEEGEAHLRHAHALGSMKAAAALGGQYAAADRTEEAETLYRQAAQADDPRGMVGLGALLSDRGEAEEARRWWLRAAELDEATAMHMLADAAEAGGNDEEARYWWDVAARRLNDPFAMLRMGLHLYDRQAPEAGEQWLARAVDASGGAAAPLVAQELSTRGHHEAARRWRHG